MYRREIIYIGLYRDEEKIGNAGFLKAESGERECRLYLKVQNIPPGISGRFPVRLYSGTDWKELNGVSVQDGGGCWEERLSDTVRMPMLQIRLSGGYRLEGGSRTAPEHSAGRSEREEEAEAVIVTEELLPEAPQKAAQTRREMPEHSCKEDKWEQILDSYERLHPYGDGRVCVKLEPKDFVILQGKYQHLVNNSFLLHGFYNYRYVILGKEKDDYYLGVPGVFYEREKMVAQMFGFEAFECPGGEVKTGEFGYYLRTVEL